MFVAKHHVTLNGRHYLPGEVIENKVPTDTAKWWLSVGAVEVIMDPPYRETTPPPPLDPSGDTDDTDDHEDVPDDTDDQEDERVDSDGQEEEIDEQAEPEEIDVSAGIVPPSQKPEKPKTKRTPRERGGNKS